MTKLSPSAEFLSTAQVADALGIGVSTVKRWVEEGILPATKTAGGHRKLLLADVLEVARQNNLPVRNLSQFFASAAKTREAAPAVLSAELYQLLLDGDSKKVRAIIHGAYRSGTPLEALADLVIAPAMHRIGADWEAGRIDVMHEHRASQLCASALHELKEVLETRAMRQRPSAVGGAVEGDPSVLPSLLAQLVLLDAGWNAVDLGPNTPLASLARAIAEISPRLVWLSMSHPVDEEVFRREYLPLYQHAQEAGVALVIGGRALSDTLRASIPYTAHGDGLRHLAAFARTLEPRPRRPRRGRPRRT